MNPPPGHSYRPKLSFHPSSSDSASRPFYIHGGTVSQASGSAICEIGLTKVVCAVYGPRPRKAGGRAEFVNEGTLEVEAKFANFSRSFASAEEQDEANRVLSHQVSSALEASVQLYRFTKSELDLFVSVLQDDGSSLTCAVMGASFALAKSGIEMFDLVSSVTIGMKNDGDIYVNPTSQQQVGLDVQATISMHMSTGNISGIEINGQHTQAQFESLLHLANDAAQQYAQVIRHQLVTEAQSEMGEL